MQPPCTDTSCTDCLLPSECTDCTDCADCSSPPPSPARASPTTSDDEEEEYSSSGEGQHLRAAKRQQQRKDRSPSWKTPDIAAPPPPPNSGASTSSASLPTSLVDTVPRPQRPPPPLELTEGELLELALPDDKAILLTAREQTELIKVRQKCARLGKGPSLMASAQRHAFKLVMRNSQRVAVCLWCEGRDGYEPTATGGNDRFLNHFWSRHLAKSDSGHHSAVPSRRAGAAAASDAAQVGDQICANLAAAAASRLSVEQLAALRSLDDPELSDEQRVAADALRQHIHERFDGGAMLHVFRLAFKVDVWMVECVCCGTQQNAQSGEHFLHHFASRHLADARHHHAATRRGAAILSACRDASRSSAAEAQAAAGRASFSGEADHAARLAEEARQAAQRAEAIAERLAAMNASGDLPLPSILRCGEVQSQPMVPTELETLVGANPALAWLKNAEGDRIGVCCNFCRRKKLEGSSEADLLRKVQEHITKSNEHLERSAHGGATLLSFFGARSRGPAPAPHTPDLSTLCYGYYKPTLILQRGDGSSFTADVRFLLERTPSSHSSWRPDAYFTGTLSVGALSGAPQEVDVEGTLRSNRCRRFNLGADGTPGLHGMCDACRALPRDHGFKEMVRKHHGALQRPPNASKTRFDLMPHARRLEVIRSLAASVRLLRQQLFTLGLKYQYKCRRVRSFKVS